MHGDGGKAEECESSAGQMHSRPDRPMFSPTRRLVHGRDDRANETFLVHPRKIRRSLKNHCELPCNGNCLIPRAGSRARGEQHQLNTSLVSYMTMYASVFERNLAVTCGGFTKECSFPTWSQLLNNEQRNDAKPSIADAAGNVWRDSRWEVKWN